VFLATSLVITDHRHLLPFPPPFTFFPSPSLSSLLPPCLGTELFANVQALIIRSLLSVQKVIINDKHCFELSARPAPPLYAYTGRTYVVTQQNPVQTTYATICHLETSQQLAKPQILHRSLVNVSDYNTLVQHQLPQACVQRQHAVPPIPKEKSSLWMASSRLKTGKSGCYYLPPL